MTQNNLYMEDDELKLYVDVQPLFIDELENSKNAAAASAQSASQSAANAQTWLNNIITYKTNLELYYAQSMNNLSDWYSNAVVELTNLKNTCLQAIQNLSDSVISSINSLYLQIISTGQSYVNQTREYAEQARDTVDNRVSEEYLIQSNALKTGSISNISNVLEDITNYARSTYDASKFTKVGSPIVTSDGIASGFSSSDYIKPNISTVSNITNLEYQIKFTTGASHSDVETIFTTRDATHNYIQLYYGAIGSLKIDLANSNSVPLVADFVVDDTFRPNTTYDIIIKINATTLNVKVNGVLLQEQTFTNSTFALTPNYTTIGTRYVSGSQIDRPFNGSIDLKQFLITVDGVPVFSGNKTGIDVIKPTNFTVNTTMYAFVYDTHTIYANSSTAPTELYNEDGTLYTGSDWEIVTTTVDDVTTYDVQYNSNSATYTSGSNITASTTNSPFVNPKLPLDAGVKITEDGIAGNFGNSKYITNTSLSITPTKNFDVFIPFSLPQEPFSHTNAYIAVLRSGSNDNLTLGIVKSGSYYYYQLYIRDVHGWTNSSRKADWGKDGIVWVNWNGTTWSYKISVDDGATWSNLFSDTSSTTGITADKLRIGAGYTNLDTRFLQAKVDLNKFKIYADGDLKYQPMLYIPYTESKTGSKVVDAIYRDRVNDMAEQFGYANYYTLSDSDFSLPNGDIYGMIENLRKLIIEKTSEQQEE